MIYLIYLSEAWIYTMIYLIYLSEVWNNCILNPTHNPAGYIQ